MGELLPRLMAILETDHDLFEKIRQTAREYVTFLSRNSFLPLFIVNEANRNPQFFSNPSCGTRLRASPHFGGKWKKPWRRVAFNPSAPRNY